MKKYHKFILFSLLIIVLGALTTWGDQREPKDIIVALDRSLSMEEEIEEVKRYVNTYIIDKTLIDGDYFLLLTFFRNAELAAATTVQGMASKEALKEQVDQIKATGQFTDIGNVLDRLGDEMLERINNGRNKSFLLITDGINEPPPTSDYYTADGVLKHEYLDKLDDILVKETWKVQILALGTDTETKDFAKELQANYIETGENLTAEEIARIAPDIAGIMTISDTNKALLNTNGQGKGHLIITIKTDGFIDDPSLEIDQISLNAAPYFKDNLLVSSSQHILPKTGETEIKIPVILTGKLNAGNYQGTVNFSFTSKEKFPSQLDITLHINNIIEDNPWLLPIIIAGVLILAGLLVLLISKLILGKSIEFRILIDESPLPKNRDTFKVNKSRGVYLVESMDMIRVVDKKSVRAFAEIYSGENGLLLHAIKEKYLPEVTKDIQDAIGKSIRVVTEQNTIYHVKFTEPV
ncbi:MAG: VWA domain-containing protein [Spirochaetales bacterium]|nr:VWA domain-containing protein [Spirochaetales bacterium]